MNRFFTIGILGLLLISSVSGYYCIYNTDNDAVKEFKHNINQLAINEDVLVNNLSEETLILKLKYFSPCR